MLKISNLVKEKTNTIEGEVILNSDEIILYSTKHIGPSIKGGAPMIPIFKGRLMEENNKVVLRGNFSIDPFCKLIIGILFGAAALFIISDTICDFYPNAEIWLGHSTGKLWGIFIWLLLLILLLEGAFWIGIEDIKYLSQKIQDVLSKK